MSRAHGQNRRRQRDHGAMRMRKHLVNHAMPGNSGKSGCPLGSQDNQVSLLGPCMVEQFLRRVAGDHNRLNRKLVS